MSVTITVVHGSHPCVTVERALELKGIPYKTTELPPPLHAAIQRIRTGARTVPSMKLDGEQVSGSRAILRRLDAYVPHPPLYGTDDAERMRIEEAEAWGDEELQGLVRRVLWPALARSPAAIPSFQEGSKLPGIPAPVVTLLAPGITRIEGKLNAASERTLPGDLAALPAMFDRIDAWLADGTLGGEPPNAADLQIAPSIALLATIGDLAPAIAARPLGPWATRVAGTPTGALPAGVLADVLPPAFA
jgi:glutathione S-transferase